MKKTICIGFIAQAAIMVTACTKIFSQIPFKINSSTGLHAVDLSNNPILNDKNWNLTPVFEDQFDNPSTTQNSKFRFYANGDSHAGNDDFFNFAEDPQHDNMPPVTSGSPNQFTLSNPSNHFFGTDVNGVTYVKLVSKPQTVQAYYRDYAPQYAPQNYYIAKNYSYSTGLMISRNAYKFGYFEARIKVNRPANNQSRGLGQCFWLYADWTNNSQPPNLPTGTQRITNYSEIDIAENDPRRGLMTSNFFFKPLNSSTMNSVRLVNDCTNQGSVVDKTVDQTNYHTYALEWTPTEMNTYYDNILVRHMEYKANDFDPMNIIIDIEGTLHSGGFHGRFCNLALPSGGTTYPFEYSLDYVRIYKLNNSTCNVSMNFPNYNFSSYSHGLKKSIIFGQNNCSGCSAKVQNGANISLRAVEYIELNDGFEVDANPNTEFFATVNGSCAN